MPSSHKAGAASEASEASAAGPSGRHSTGAPPRVLTSRHAEASRPACTACRRPGWLVLAAAVAPRVGFGPRWSSRSVSVRSTPCPHCLLCSGGVLLESPMFADGATAVGVSEHAGGMPSRGAGHGGGHGATAPRRPRRRGLSPEGRGAAAAPAAAFAPSIFHGQNIKCVTATPRPEAGWGGGRRSLRPEAPRAPPRMQQPQRAPGAAPLAAYPSRPADGRAR